MKCCFFAFRHRLFLFSNIYIVYTEIQMTFVCIESKKLLQTKSAQIVFQENR